MLEPPINYTWEWDCQLRIHKPKRANKKAWVDWVALAGKTPEQLLRSCQAFCQAHGWTLLEVLRAEPMRLGYAFWAREGFPDLTPSERRQHLPLPAACSAQQLLLPAQKTTP